MPAPRDGVSPLRRGVYLPPFGPFGDPNVLVDLAIRAEAAGWDGVFLWDHVIGAATPIADCWTALAAMAAGTSRIVLGSTVTPLPRRRPWVLARQVSTVSRLSGGRAVLGIGLGSDETGDLSGFAEATSLDLRSALADESLDIIRGIWSGSPVEHAGPHLRAAIPAGEPDPHPTPVWVACSVPHPNVVARAVRCDGIFPISIRPPRPEAISAIVDGLDGAGLEPHRPFDVVIAGNASPAWERPNPDGVDLPALGRAGATWWMESLMHFDPLELSMQVVDAGPP